MTQIEKVLYSYFENLGKMERIQRDISRLASVHGLQMEKNVGDVIVDPVARRMDHVEKLESELEELKRWTVPVTRLVRDLPDELLYVLDQGYFRRRPWMEIWRRKGWSRWAGWRRKKELLRMAEKYIGA
ncbi:MAG: hypothetical protein IJR68_04690 [Fretibacterium sp.]|nr:hypothetical protein [Fretibacterium sp.]